MSERIVASYEIETAYPLEAAVAVMAGEQSTGTFTRAPGETDALRDAHGARVERIVETGGSASPALPGAGAPASAGVECALMAHWRAAGEAHAPPPTADAGPVARLAAVSGSCSPVTVTQLRHAIAHGFEGVAVDARALAMPIAPGSPLCRGHAPGGALDGPEIALKGGQVGGAAYFNQVRDGSI